jgi:hypothetical protein
MSTVKSSSANLTLNADGSGNDIKFQSNAVEKGSLTDGGVWTGSTFEPTGDTAASDNAAIGYTATEGLILTGQGSTNDVTIKNDADATVLEVATGGVNVELTAGNLIIGTAGKGIDFSAQTASTSGTTTSEVLDHYEEGTFTPALVGTWASDPTNMAGTYTKIGRTVHINIFWNNGNKTGAYNGYFSGLPFSVSLVGTGVAVDGGIIARGSCLVANTYLYVTHTGAFGVNMDTSITYTTT